jgi:sugar phosphate isomerase/epimerase
VAPLAADRGVRVLLETHDSHRTGAAVARILGLVGHRSIGALWDVLHTWLGGEEPADTHAALAPYLGYVQVKDVASAEDPTPLPLGAGTVPLAAVLATLDHGTGSPGSAIGREPGWLCWEYEKRWYPQAAELPGLLAAGREHLQRLLDTPVPVRSPAPPAR